VSRTLPLPDPLRIGAGISTGTAILGGTDYTALGDTVNAAFRLEAATKTIGLGVALGQGAFEALESRQQALFRRHEVQLKGYEKPPQPGLSPSMIFWSISPYSLAAPNAGHYTELYAQV
jgi:adenylate cyclase